MSRTGSTGSSRTWAFSRPEQYYLEPFCGFAAQAELQAAHEVALRLGWICRALNVHRFASGLPAPYRKEHLQGVGVRLRMLLAGFD